MRSFMLLLCAVVLCILSATVTPSRAAAPFAAPPVPNPAALRLFATAQNGNAIAYAWQDAHGVSVYNGTQHTYAQPVTHKVSALAIALLDPATPVVAWHDGTGIHAAIWNDASTPGIIIQFWQKTDFGTGRNPQLLTNPLRLIYFNAHGYFMCEGWLPATATWTTGCQA